MTDHDNSCCQETTAVTQGQVATQDGAREGRTFAPRYHVNKLDDGWTLEVQLPGVERDAIELAVENRVLTLKARRAPFDKGTKQELFTEFEDRSFERSFHLAEEVDLDRLEARLDKGILTLRLHKAGPQRKSITVSTD